jgi:hypothetical protein
MFKINRKTFSGRWPLKDVRILSIGPYHIGLDETCIILNNVRHRLPAFKCIYVGHHVYLDGRLWRPV